MKRLTFLVLICWLTLASSLGQITKGNEKGAINGHEYVDLGLSVKWATCNIGATSPSDYGDYYAWGEITPKTSYEKNNKVLLPKKLFKISGNPKYDAACANWGGTWRLPTRKEVRELARKCRWVLTNLNGHEGYQIIGPNGNHIFIPFAGYRSSRLLYFQGEYGFIWGGVADIRDRDVAFSLGFSFHFNGNGTEPGWTYRYYGRSIRPVTE